MPCPSKRQLATRSVAAVQQAKKARIQDLEVDLGNLGDERKQQTVGREAEDSDDSEGESDLEVSDCGDEMEFNRYRIQNHSIYSCLY
jgi:hypothetical protein